MLSDNFCIEKIKSVVYLKPTSDEPQKIAFNSSTCTNEIIYHLGGKSTVYFNNTVLSVQPGTVRFLPAGPVNRYIVDREEYGPCIDIYFSSNAPLAAEAFVIDMSENAKIRDLFEKCYSLWIHKESGYYLRCMSILYQIIAIVFVSAYHPKDKQQLIAPGEKYIYEHYKTENINIPYLADLCGISETYFKKLFVAKHSMTPKKYITHIRMEEAKDLLLTNEYTVSQVAELTGFENIYYFSRVFKQEFNMSPITFLKKFSPEGNAYSKEQSSMVKTVET